jgi:hypothetical protein
VEAILAALPAQLAQQSVRLLTASAHGKQPQLWGSGDSNPLAPMRVEPWVASPRVSSATCFPQPQRRWGGGDRLQGHGCEWGCGVTAPAAAIVYDNTAETLGPDVGTGPPQEIGNQITLAGTARIVTDFLFGYYGSPDVHATVKFYANDGHKGAPKTRLFDSGPFVIEAGQDHEKILSGLRVEVPDSLSLYLYGPPTVGTCNHMWMHGGAEWWTTTVESSTGHKASGLKARVTAVASLPRAHWSEEVEAQILLGVINDAGGFVRLGGHIIRVPPRQPVEAILAALPARLAQQLVPLLMAAPHGKQPEAALRQQLAEAIARHQEQSRG